MSQALLKKGATRMHLQQVTIELMGECNTILSASTFSIGIGT